MVSHVEHFFMYLLAIFFRKMSIQVLCPFVIRLFVVFATKLYGFLIYFMY